MGFLKRKEKEVMKKVVLDFNDIEEGYTVAEISEVLGYWENVEDCNEVKFLKVINSKRHSIDSRDKIIAVDYLGENKYKGILVGGVYPDMSKIPLDDVVTSNMLYIPYYPPKR